MTRPELAAVFYALACAGLVTGPLVSWRTGRFAFAVLLIDAAAAADSVGDVLVFGLAWGASLIPALIAACLSAAASRAARKARAVLSDPSPETAGPDADTDTGRTNP